MLQDYIFQAFKEYHPGDNSGRNTSLHSLRSPGIPTSASGALSALRKWVDLHERARGLSVEWPRVSESYAALDNIIAIGLSSGEKVKTRSRRRGGHCEAFKKRRSLRSLFGRRGGHCEAFLEEEEVIAKPLKKGEVIAKPFKKRGGRCEAFKK